MKIGLISDTHNYLDPKVASHFKDCDEIWHIGDFGNIKIADELRKIAPIRGVYGNIDGKDIQQEFPHDLEFEVQGIRFFITHIGGNPGRYAIPIREKMASNPPDVFICGHSHILKVVRDSGCGNMLFINPGAAGRQGFQIHRTIMRFSIQDGQIKDMEVINLD